MRNKQREKKRNEAKSQKLFNLRNSYLSDTLCILQQSVHPSFSGSIVLLSAYNILTTKFNFMVLLFKIFDISIFRFVFCLFFFIFCCFFFTLDRAKVIDTLTLTSYKEICGFGLQSQVGGSGFILLYGEGRRKFTVDVLLFISKSFRL